ncbi:MAG: zinc-dependent peptidase [Saprospiraceae bacterium]|nr:zinc-dependent peptidase [Saprospiraceae bacterium]
MFANYIAAPFVFGALICLYLAWEVDNKYALWIIPFVIIAALIYVFSPQINWWRYRSKPPALKPALVALLDQHCLFYRQLDNEGRQKFRDRISLFRMGVDWTPMGWPEETLPVDVELAVAAQAVTVGFGEEDFLFPAFEKVIIYPYPFPSPEYPFAHASELHEPDGCLLFSAEQLMMAFFQPGKWYNIGLHEYARVFQLQNPNLPYPVLDQEAWPRLERVAPHLTRQLVEATIGLAGVDPLPVAIHHYFTFSEPFRTQFPEEAAVFDLIFKKA